MLGVDQSIAGCGMNILNYTSHAQPIHTLLSSLVYIYGERGRERERGREGGREGGRGGEGESP